MQLLLPQTINQLGKLFFQILFSKQTWILKNDLLNIPFFGWGLRLLDPIAINRKINCNH